MKPMFCDFNSDETFSFNSSSEEVIIGLKMHRKY